MRLVTISVTPVIGLTGRRLPSLTVNLLPIADVIAREPVFIERLVDFFRRDAVREKDVGN